MEKYKTDFVNQLNVQNIHEKKYIGLQQETSN